MEENIHCIWLSGKQFPRYNTINNLRSLHLKSGLFVQVVLMPVEMGHLTLKEQYVGGTEMESRANKSTFVRKKTVEKSRVKLEAKIRCILQQIEEGIAN